MGIEYKPCKAHDWGRGDHTHICYALRLLKKKDFKSICPLAHKKIPDYELDDACDNCLYFGQVDFRTDPNRNKKAFFIMYHDNEAEFKKFVGENE